MLETERFQLKPIEESDAESLFPITSDPEVTKFMRFSKHNNIEETRELIRDYHANNDHAYLVIEKGTSATVGVFAMKVNHENPDDLVLSIYFGREFWGKGANTELSRFFVDNCNRLFGNKTLTAFIVEANQASCHVVEKLGFELSKKMTFENWDGVLHVYTKNFV